MTTSTARSTRAVHPLLRVGVVVLLLVAASLRYSEVRGALDALDDVDSERPELRDFRDTIYVPGIDFRDGNVPYDADPYVARHPGHQELDLYTPHVFVLAVPMSALPIALAQGLWLLVILAALVVIAWMCLALAGRAANGWEIAGIVGVLLLTNPVLSMIVTGNISVLVISAALGALLWSERRPVLAGVLVAVAMLKAQTGLPLVVLLGFALWRWRPVVIGLAGAAALSVVPLLVLVGRAGGVGGFADVLEHNLEVSERLYGDLAGREDLARSDIWGGIGKLLQVNPTTATQVALFLVVSVVLVRVTRRCSAADGDQAAVLTLGLVSIVAGLPHFPYDLTLLAPTIVVLLVAGRPWSPIRIALLVALAIPMVHLGRVDEAITNTGASVFVAQSIDGLMVGAAFVLAALTAMRDAGFRGRLDGDADQVRR